ncbi:hypothetical protein Geob_3366 [Geotalea daltonii FRC-32]|uniref:Tetratricopeptide repeat protein n=1 Tax=Geotalea daltonii (strain DSM 22248 / JCM 15807 / FRC-32) TaxID=316067 RepID=B9M525_GEODF|nr:hypothetical protein [Geotalea daltonii]ACM21709.1 hypothetical protein Geob_3366 [Geotalea daltonii FRC-32]
MKRVVATILLMLYLVVWSLQKGKGEWIDSYLSPAPPAPVLKVATGYAQQLAAFGLFVKIAVFTGGPLKGVDKMSYADSMAQNFDVMTELYPDFIDPYHYCESFLAPISADYAERANKILDRGIATKPDVMYLGFFKAVNYYYYMSDYAKAAEEFYALSKRPDALPWFGHMAGMLMGRGGNLVAGRNMLQVMLAIEKDEYLKKRYRRGIENFNNALKVQSALDLYRKERGHDPRSLSDIVPHYIHSLPQMAEGFILIWDPPLLRLERPQSQGRVKKDIK